eukprot:1159476-Pelagomonas_calceolata.AAC.4
MSSSTRISSISNGPSSIVSSSTASLNSTENRPRAAMPTVEVDAACSSPIRNQSLPGSACSSPAGANHVIVLVGHAHNGEGGGGAGAGVNASQDTRAASRPQHEENSQGGGGETRAGDNGGAAVGDGKQGLLEQASFKKKGSTERAPPSQKGADDRPLSAGMTECRICLSTDDAGA